MFNVTEDMVGHVVRTVEYNTGNDGPETISATHIRVHLCANSSYPVNAVNQAITVALKRGDLVEEDDKYALASSDTYRKYL